MKADLTAARHRADDVLAALWRTDPMRQPPLQRFALIAVRTLIGLVRDLSRGDLTLWAMSLVYTTLLAMVPLLAISFSILKGFGVHNQIEPLLQDLLAPLGDRAGEVTNQIISFVDNINVGVLGALGVAFLFWTAVALMQKVERAFNRVWHVGRGRSLAQRFRDYLVFLLLAPTVIVLALGVSAAVMSSAMMGYVVSIEPFGVIVNYGGRLMPFVMNVAALTFMYAFIPNTRVRLLPALTGALVASILWYCAGWGFAKFAAGANNYAAIYSTFASAILFLIWLYIIWLVLLIGNSIAFYVQYPAQAEAGIETWRARIRDLELLALAVATLIARRFYAGDEPWTEEALAHDLQQHVHVIHDVVETLERGGLLRLSADDPPALLPARPLEEVSAADVLQILRNDGVSLELPDEAKLQALPPLLDRADATVGDTLGGVTLKQLGLDAAGTAVTPLPAQASRGGERQKP